MLIPNLSVEGKVAIITGSSQGIGNTLAKGFGKAGASVALAARSADRLEEAVEEIKSQGGRALAVPTDVSDSSQVSDMVRQTVETFGRVDVLINCAGGTGADRFIPLLDLEEAVWDRIVDLNLRSVYLCCRAVGRVMTEEKRGSVINVSSGAATAPVAGLTYYCAAKSGVNQFTRALAMEWGAYNVRVNAISPGMTDTPAERDHMPPEILEKYAGMVPLGRIGQPEDLLGAALFLASDASAFITGVIIPVSGGPQ